MAFALTEDSRAGPCKFEASPVVDVAVVLAAMRLVDGILLGPGKPDGVCVAVMRVGSGARLDDD
jgi:hypothetical protein